MHFLFALNFAVSLFICFFLIVSHFKLRKNPKLNKILNTFSFIGLLYFFISISSLLWFFDILKYSQADFVFLYAIIVVVQSILFFRIIYLITLNKRLLYFLIFYVVSVLPLFYSVFSFLHLIIIISFLVLFLFFLSFIFKKGGYRALGYFGMFYSLVAIVLQLFLIFDFGGIYFFNFLLNVIFLFLIIFFMTYLKKHSSLIGSRFYRKDRPLFLVVLSHLFFVIIFINFIFIGTIGLHEFGHLTISKFSDCDYRKIVYEESFFHTEIVCNNVSDTIPVLLGGILFPFLLAIFLFFLGGKFMKEMASLIVGFNLLSLTNDLRVLGLSDNLIFGILFIGGVAFSVGVVLITRFRIEEDIYLSK